MQRVTFIVLMNALAGSVAAQPFQIEQPTIAGGGGDLAAGTFAIKGVINPQAGGRLQSGTFELTGGLFPLDQAPADCPADTNGDGILSPSDFNAWVLAFNNQAAACDQNGDGLCTPADFNSWILNYNAGC